MVKVKICGLTRFEDAAIALEAGADFLGFILYPPSPRAIAPEAAAALVRELREKLPAHFARPEPPRLVGVFVNQDEAFIAATLEACGLDLAQLSGEEEPGDYAGEDSPLRGRAYKAIRPTTPAAARELAQDHAAPPERFAPGAPRLLLDTPHAKLFGGTGETGDWTLAAELAAAQPGLMLAGGLNPDNVAAAVAAVRPFAVDVASGVEERPGVKNLALLRAFIANAKNR